MRIAAHTPPAPWLMVLRMLLSKNPFQSRYMARLRSGFVSFRLNQDNLAHRSLIWGARGPKTPIPLHTVP
jgi:hypothetical protein